MTANFWAANAKFLVADGHFIVATSLVFQRMAPKFSGFVVFGLLGFLAPHGEKRIEIPCKNKENESGTSTRALLSEGVEGRAFASLLPGNPTNVTQKVPQIFR